MKDFRRVEKKINVLDRKISCLQEQTKNQTPKDYLNPTSQSNVNSIFDKERFSNWFNKYKLSTKLNLKFSLDEELLWKKYEKTILNNSYVECKPLITSDGRSPQAEFLLCDDLEVFYGAQVEEEKLLPY